MPWVAQEKKARFSNQRNAHPVLANRLADH
jgi:hypothetical protein